MGKISKHLAILNDSRSFGGHEIAFIRLLPAVINSELISRVDILIYKNNAELLNALIAIDHEKVNVSLSDFHKGPGETIVAPFRFHYGRAVSKFVKTTGADIVLLLQGRIESLSTPLLWLPVDTDIVSYIPMAHSSEEMGHSPFRAQMLDWVKRRYYVKPKRFITISFAGVEQLKRAGATAPIYVVENVPTIAAPDLFNREQARSELGLTHAGKIALFMGRFDARQKGLDRLIRDLRLCVDSLGDWNFLFVGDGPARAELEALFAETTLKGGVWPWSTTPQLYMTAADLILMPSRFEGVPLVLLDALSAYKPVLASEIDVFKEYLPAFMLRNFQVPVDLSMALEDLISPVRIEEYKRHVSSILDRLESDKSQRRFLAALLGSGRDLDPAMV